MSDRKPSSSRDDAPKAKKRKQDSSIIQKPKRPLSAYNLFFRDERTRYLQERAAKKAHENTDKSPFLAMSAEISRRWMSLPLEQRQKYHAMAEEETIKYHLKVDAFKAGRSLSEQPNDSTARRRIESTLQENSQAHDSVSLFSSMHNQTENLQSLPQNANPLLRLLLSHHQPQEVTSGQTSSMNYESNPLLQFLQQQQTERYTAFPASVPHEQANRQLNDSHGDSRYAAMPPTTSFDQANLQANATREAIMAQDNTALLQLILDNQQQFRSRQLPGLGVHSHSVNSERQHRNLLLGNTSQNQSLQGSLRPFSFLPANATDMSHGVPFQPSNLTRDHLSSIRAATNNIFVGNTSSQEEKDISPIINQVPAEAGLSSASRDDPLLRMLLANQLQRPPFHGSNSLHTSEHQIALARQQHALSQSSRLISAFIQGWRAANEDEVPQEPSDRSPT